FQLAPHHVLRTLSLHDALPIAFAVRCPQPWRQRPAERKPCCWPWPRRHPMPREGPEEIRDEVSPYQLPFSETAITTIVKKLRLRDRKSTRLNSSHVRISYAVFC